MRLPRLFILTAMLVLLAAPVAQGKSHVRIVGGTATPITSTPWQVGLLLRGTDDTYQAQMCGGTIRDAYTIITAAHCVDGYPASTFDVLAGTATLGDDSGQRIQVAQIAVDPAYDDEGGVGIDDAALLKLSAPINFSLSATALPPITPTESLAIDSPSDQLLVSGWGSTIGYSASSPPNCEVVSCYPKALRSVTVPFVTDTACSTPYPDLDTATQLCAGAAGKDSCQGDSGGPLVFNSGGTSKLAGIVSRGDGCAAVGYPGVYAEVGSASVNSFVTGPLPPEDGSTDDSSDDGSDDSDDDVDEPAISLVRKLCNRQTCNLLLSVNDPDPSSGIHSVRASVRSMPTVCASKKAKKKPKCQTTRKVKTRAGGGDAYTVTLTKLKRGRHTVTITAEDNSGNVGSRRIKIKSR
jgi:hypothetical protein